MTNRGREGAPVGGLQTNQPRFQIRVEPGKGETAVLALAGEFDLASEEEFRERVQEARRDGLRRIVLDLRLVTFIDSTGLRLVLAAWERSRNEGFELVLVRGSEAVQRVLEMTGMEDVLPMVDEVSEIG